MTQPTPGQRLRGLAATLVILLLVAGVPFLLVAIGAAPWNANLSELGTLLVTVTVIGLVLPLVAILLTRAAGLRSA